MEVLDKKRLLSQIAFISILAVVTAIALFYLINLIKWRNVPDFGFGFRNATGIKVVGVLRKPGEKAGLRVGDRILLVNGKPYDTYLEFNSAKNWEPNDKNMYLIERDSRQFEATITNIPYGLKRTLEASGMPFLVGLCYALIGTLVFLMKPHHRPSWAFFLFSVTLGLLLTFLFKVSVLRPYWLENFIIFAYCFLPSTMIHLAFAFPQERRLLKKLLPVKLLPYLISGILFILIRSATPTMLNAPSHPLIAVVAYLAFGVLFFVGSNVQLRLMSTSEIVIRRAKMILLGFAIAASVPLLDFAINTLFRVYLIPGFNYYLPFFIVFPAFVGYSILKHDLFDIDAIIKRTYGYILTTGAIAGIYALFVFVSNLAFGRFEITKSPLFPLIFILAVVFLFNPVRNRMQKFIDRVFYRLEYDYRETVQRISESMRTLLGLDEIGKSIMDTALGVMFIDSGRVMLLDKQKQAYECLTMAGEREERRAGMGAESTMPAEEAEKKGKIMDIETGEREEEVPKPREGRKEDLRLAELKLPADDPLIQKIAERKKEVTIYDIQEDPFFEADRASCEKAFDQLGATLIVPLIYEDKLTGLISLGEKKSGKFYGREDINLLNTLANQGAVAIENAQMVEEVIEKERMEEELSIARDLQTSMLPATCPEIEGFRLAALSTQAREVGGDFFDFIEMGEARVGLVVGDVTGKSVSGALVMSASRSVFRMLSEEEISVGEIMIRANRRIKQDIKTGMFVALLYAVLNAQDKTLAMCSAGQTQPIHFSSKTGEAMLVQTEGDTFPLGILEDSQYQETKIQLAPGDKIVFYTDGIVEAMNEQEEMFGFERLLEVVKEARALDADSLLKEVIDKVNIFVGGAAQHDDLTVIVVSVE